MLRSHNDIVARTQYEYLRELTELNSRLRRFPGTKQGPQFPSTIEAYHKLSGNKGTLLEVARYLMADDGKRTQMRDVYKWPSQQTEPLIEEYNKNVSPCFIFMPPSLPLFIPFSVVEIRD